MLLIVAWGCGQDNAAVKLNVITGRLHLGLVNECSNMYVIYSNKKMFINIL